MCQYRTPPWQTWRTFLENHRLDIAAIHIFVVATVRFSLLTCLVIRCGRLSVSILRRSWQFTVLASALMSVSQVLVETSVVCVFDHHGKHLQTRQVQGGWDRLCEQLVGVGKPFQVCFEACCERRGSPPSRRGTGCGRGKGWLG